MLWFCYIKIDVFIMLLFLSGFFWYFDWFVSIILKWIDIFIEIDFLFIFFMLMKDMSLVCG